MNRYNSSKLINKNKLCLFFLFFIIGCSKNTPIVFEDFQALRCELNFKEKNYNDYVFNINTGFLHYYDEIKDEFLPISERLESGIFIENSSEIFSVIQKNNLLITKIEYYKDLNKNQKFIKNLNIINLKTLTARSIFKNKNGEYVVKRGKCIWIDPKLGIRY
ncbi:hypothetical protein [Prochlorococcus marinus]|uniref:Lipoprotein n=1 Tax=Prochlorococcus marinus (strain MIT 9301) TaxID=167546 RepID=A3PC54_PROM0|nr:hypothetical protein [Prochlorococcus marinus]ABO17329.1 Hypothetical protein P9301_07061 [Prochlorococcus marinus str. MIT 9301]